MRRILAVVGAVLALAAITTGVVFALNYEGEDFCQDSPAWPNGTYLGQMHPYHSDFYRGYAERRGWDPCTTWATDQRNSAIRGLRELGYTVIEPEEAPITAETAVLWVYLYDGRFGLEAQVEHNYTSMIDTFDLDVSVFVGDLHVGDFCNNSAIFPNELSSALSCTSPDYYHSSVTRVTAEVSDSGYQTEHLKCFKSVDSSEDRSIFGCNPR